jgi:hypothetical protein
MSSSGHSATNPSSSRSMIAVRRRCRCMIRVYNGCAGLPGKNSWTGVTKLHSHRLRLNARFTSLGYSAVRTHPRK